MPVDPIVKQDLLLVKSHFESQALTQTGMEPTVVPLAGALRGQEDAMTALQNGLKRYPSVYAANYQQDQSKLQKLQQECAPCLSRLGSLVDCDLDIGLHDILMNFNTGVLSQIQGLFNSLTAPSDVDTHMCDTYQAFRSQCLPDISRAISAISFLISDIRNLDLKISTQDFIQLVMSIAGTLIGNMTFNLDKFQQLVTNTIDCMMADMEAQLRKLDPILSKANRKKAAEQLKDALKKTQTLGEQDLYQPVENVSTSVGQTVQQAGQQVSKTIGLAESGINEILDNTLHEASRRVSMYCGQAQLELNKLCQSNVDQLQAINDLIAQIRNAMSILDLLKTMAGLKNFSDPCDSVEQARRLFNQLSSPGNQVIIDYPLTATNPVTGTPEPETNGTPSPAVPNTPDVVVTLVPRSVVVPNSVVQDLLRAAGITLRQLTSGVTVTSADPVIFSLFGCLGQQV